MQNFFDKGLDEVKVQDLFLPNKEDNDMFWNKEAKEEKQKLIDDHRSKIDTLQSDNMVLSAWIEDHLSSATEQKEEASMSIQGLNQYKAKFNADIKKLVKDVKFFESNDACPTCTQPITEETKQLSFTRGLPPPRAPSGETQQKTPSPKRSCFSSAITPRGVLGGRQPPD